MVLVCSNAGHRFCKVAARALCVLPGLSRIFLVPRFLANERDSGCDFLASSISFIVIRNTQLRFVGTEMKLGSARSLILFPIFLAASRQFKASFVSAPRCMQEDWVHAPRYPTLTSFKTHAFIAGST